MWSETYRNYTVVWLSIFVSAILMTIYARLLVSCKTWQYLLAI